MFTVLKNAIYKIPLSGNFAQYANLNLKVAKIKHIAAKLVLTKLRLEPNTILVLEKIKLPPKGY